MTEDLRRVHFAQCADPAGKVHLIRGQSNLTVCGAQFDKHTWSMGRGITTAAYILARISPNDCRACLKVIEQSAPEAPSKQGWNSVITELAGLSDAVDAPPPRTPGDATTVLTEPIKRQLDAQQRRTRDAIYEFLDFAEREGRHDVSNLRQNVEEFMKASWMGFYVPPRD